MDNHYHLLVQTPEAPLSRAMRHIDGIYTQRFNRAHRRDGPLFRGRYRAILIEPEEYFMAVARYIHRNPVQSQSDMHMTRYRWSSHRAYLDKKRRPQWLDVDSLLSRFGKGSQGLSAYKRFMEEEVEKELREFYQEKYLRPILGGKDFVERVKGKVEERAKRDEEISEARRLFRPGIGDIVSATARVYGKREEEFSKKDGGMAMRRGRWRSTCVGH
jgi:putative transposase